MTWGPFSDYGSFSKDKPQQRGLFMTLPVLKKCPGPFLYLVVTPNLPSGSCFPPERGDSGEINDSERQRGLKLLSNCRSAAWEQAGGRKTGTLLSCRRRDTLNYKTAKLLFGMIRYPDTVQWFSYSGDFWFREATSHFEGKHLNLCCSTQTDCRGQCVTCEGFRTPVRWRSLTGMFYFFFFF